MNIAALNIAASGIRLGLSKLDAVAHNIANVNTPGFRRSSVVGVEVEGGGVASSIVPDTPGDLTSDLVDMILAKYTASSNATAFRAARDTTSTLVDLVG